MRLVYIICKLLHYLIIIMHLYNVSIQNHAQYRLCDSDKLYSDVLESGVHHQ